MADQFYDVLRVNDTEANILAGGIKQRMFSLATDTKKMITRSLFGYNLFPSEGSTTYFDGLGVGYTSTPTLSEAFEVNGNSVHHTTNGDVLIDGNGVSANFASGDFDLSPTSLNMTVGTDTTSLTVGDGLTLPAISSPTHAEGKIFYDDDNKCYSFFNDHTDVALQVGRELWTPRVINNSTSAISDGDVVYISGWNTTQPEITLASNDTKLEAEGVIGVATEDIAISSEGEVTRIGKVSGIVTTGETEGAPVYLGVDGAWTTTRPLPPNYIVRLGVIGEVGASGSLLIDANAFDGTDTGVNMVGALNGITTQLQGVSFVVSGGVIYADVINEENPTEKLPFIIDDDRYLLDTLTGAGDGGAARVALTPGSLNNTQINFLYIEVVATVPTLKSSTTFPFVDFAWIGIVSVLDATTTDNDGVFSWQRFNNQVDNGGGDGIFNYIMDRIRREGAVYASGIDPTITINSVTDPDEVTVSTTTGFISQAHNQQFDLQDGTVYYIVNHPTEPWKKISDLNEIDVYADGTAIANNDRFGVNIFANQNSEGGVDKLLINLPTEGYTTDSAAINDSSNLAITNMPTGSNTQNNTIRLYRLVFKYSTGASGTWTNLLGANGFQDERGFSLGQGGGGGASSSTSEFSDGQFNVFNASDATKKLTFDLSGVSTATTRNLAIPDADGVIVLDITSNWRPQTTSNSGIVVTTEGRADANVISIQSDTAAGDWGTTSVGLDLGNVTLFNTSIDTYLTQGLIHNGTNIVANFTGAGNGLPALEMKTTGAGTLSPTFNFNKTQDLINQNDIAVFTAMAYINEDGFTTPNKGYFNGDSSDTTKAIILGTYSGSYRGLSDTVGKEVLIQPNLMEFKAFDATNSITMSPGQLTMLYSSSVIHTVDNTGAGYFKTSLDIGTTVDILASGDSFFNGGDVGIGTDTPIRKLHIHDDTIPSIKLTNTSTGSTVADGSELRHFSDILQLINFEEEPIAFYTDGTEKMRVTSGGNVGIGTDSPNHLLHVSSSRSAEYIAQLFNESSAGNGLLIRSGPSAGVGSTAILNCLDGDSTAMFTVYDDGSLISLPTYSHTVGGTNRDLFIDNTGKLGYVSSSIRYKEDIDYDYDSSFILNLKPCTFKYKSGDDQTEYGLIAEDVQEIIPGLVSYNDDNEPETVSYSKLVTPMINEVKKLHNIIEDLTSRLEALEA